MERIKKALDQAQLERNARQQPGVKEPEQAEAQQPAQGQAEEVRNIDVRDVTPRINYVKTKVVPVSRETLESNRLVAALPEHELTDAYRILRTRVLQSMNSNNWDALAVTSPAQGAGKTVTAINLAISLAREVNRTVLLADFDLRRPSIHRHFGYEPKAGLSDYLFEDTPIEDILFTPSIDRLVVLPGRQSVHNSSEMLRSAKMIDLVDELKNRYPERLVIFDLPPVLAVDDALTFAPYTDAVLMVAEQGGTKRDDLEKALRILKDAPLLGTVLNKSDTKFAGSYGKS